MDPVTDPSNLWLIIHESIGQATEYDRAIYAGTSFATPDKLGSLRYGSPVMNLVGYQLDRVSAPRLGHLRSNTAAGAPNSMTAQINGPPTDNAGAVIPARTRKTGHHNR
jgi:predicted Zn-dependent protease